MQSLALTRPFHSNRVGSGVVPASRLDAIVTNDNIAAQHAYRLCKDDGWSVAAWLPWRDRDCVERKELMRSLIFWYLAGWGGNEVSTEDDACLGGWVGARR